MKNPKRVVSYIKENLGEVKHTTLNPKGPGAVRIHLVPPKAEDLLRMQERALRVLRDVRLVPQAHTMMGIR